MSSDFKELEVIHVESREILKIDPETAYCALSYVWSQAAYSDGKPRCVKHAERLYLPEDIPQLVQDALQVTQRLGVQYLWIDSYCIDQHNTEEKKRLIGQMDLIFEGALVTICAVNSDKDSRGIHGISIPMCKKTQIVHESVKGTFKTVTVPRFAKDLSQSLWNRRAWTLEEAVLSRRCLLFTENQIAFWCQSQVFHDDFIWSQTPHTINPPDAHGIHASSLAFNLHIPSEDSPWSFEAWSQTLAVYTSRQLTEERDAMRALAVLRNRISRNTCTSLPYGLPLQKGVCSLLWKARPERSYERREGFPSWSWLGWRAVVEYDHWVEPFPGVNDETRCLLGIPERGTSVWGSREFGTDFIDLISEAKVISFPTEDFEPCEGLEPLRLESHSAHFQVRWVEGNAWQVVDREGVAIPIIKGYSILWSKLHLILPEVRPHFDSKRLEFICIQHWKETAPLSTRFGDVVTIIAVTRRPQDGKATRIGSYAIPYESWAAAKPVPVVVDII
jgi:hypothetical protein